MINTGTGPPNGPGRDPGPANERLRYRDTRGSLVEVKAVAEGNDPVPGRAPLHARRLRLEYPDGSTRQVRQVRVADHTPGDRTTAYEMLDNEILAGLRLARAAHGMAYPPELSRLVGYDADSATPYVLVEPFRGRPAAESAGRLLTHDRERFQTSLLIAARWLNAAGVVHRGLSPQTVRWDDGHVQITDFSLATIPGVPRAVAGAAPWWAPEQRPGAVTGDVGDGDDMWAVGRLIHYVVTGTELTSMGQLEEEPELALLLEGIFGPPETRPSAGELLGRLGVVDPVPRRIGDASALERGRAEFYRHRSRKHPREADDEPPPTVEKAEGPPSSRLVSWAPAVVGGALLALLALLASALLVLGR